MSDTLSEATNRILHTIRLMLNELSRNPDKNRRAIARLNEIYDHVLNQQGIIHDLVAEVNFIRRRYAQYIEPPPDEQEEWENKAR